MIAAVSVDGHGWRRRRILLLKLLEDALLLLAIFILGRWLKVRLVLGRVMVVVVRRRLVRHDIMIRSSHVHLPIHGRLSTVTFRLLLSLRLLILNRILFLLLLSLLLLWMRILRRRRRVTEENHSPVRSPPHTVRASAFDRRGHVPASGRTFTV